MTRIHSTLRTSNLHEYKFTVLGAMDCITAYSAKVELNILNKQTKEAVNGCKKEIVPGMYPYHPMGGGGGGGGGGLLK